MAKKAKPEVDLGEHKGYPILEQKVSIQTGGVIDRTMKVQPIDVGDPGSHKNASLHLGPPKEAYALVYSEDDPDVILGWTQTLTFATLGAVFDDRPETAEALRDMEQRVADYEDKIKNESAGQSRMPAAGELTDEERALAERVNEAMATGDPEGANNNIRDIRAGVPDDEGRSELPSE